jgi:hypothetical protein
MIDHGPEPYPTSRHCSPNSDKRASNGQAVLVTVTRSLSSSTRMLLENSRLVAGHSGICTAMELSSTFVAPIRRVTNRALPAAAVTNPLRVHSERPMPGPMPRFPRCQILWRCSVANTLRRGDGSGAPGADNGLRLFARGQTSGYLGEFWPIPYSFLLWRGG